MDSAESMKLGRTWADTREARIIALEMAVRVAAARPQAPAHTNEVMLQRAEVFEEWLLR
jgi:hypothetical protein